MEEIKKIEVQGLQYGVADMMLRRVFGGNAQTITWDHTSNMNDYKDAGTYRIKGERTGNPLSDNLPIMNQGSGHTIDGVLYVLDSSLPNGGGKEDDCTITQFLMLSNRVGGQEGDMYMRSGFGATKDALSWKPWEKYQTNMEVGVVTDYKVLDPNDLTHVLAYQGMTALSDNGIYSGVYVGPKAFEESGIVESVEIKDPSGIETFVMVVINNYMAAGNARCITQVKFAVTNGGVFSIEKRSGQVSSFSDWEPIGGIDQQLNGYSKNAISNAAVYQQFYKQQEEIKKCATKENLKDGLDWEKNTYKEFHIKNRTHHMKDYLCKYFTGSPIEISKPSDTGYVVIAYDTDGDAKFLKIKITPNESKTEEFLDAMGLPIIFTWDAGNSTINVQSFSGSLEKLCMRAYYSSKAKSFDEYFVKLDSGFLPNLNENDNTQNSWFVDLGEVSGSGVGESKAAELAGDPSVVFIKYFATDMQQVGLIRQQYGNYGNTWQYLTINNTEYVRTVNYSSGMKGSWKNINKTSVVHQLRYNQSGKSIGFYDPINEETFGGVQLPFLTREEVEELISTMMQNT